MLGHPSNARLRRLRHRKTFLRRYRILILLLLLAAFAGCGAGSWWVYGKFKGRQSRHLTAMASDYIQQNKIPEARMALETALRLNPDNSEARRWMARVKSADGTGSASLQHWQKLAESGSLTLEDLTAYAAAAAREGEWTLAERLADAAARGGNPTLRHLIRAELLMSKKDLAGAETELRAAAEVDKTANSQAALARFLLAHRLNGETAPEILEMLRKLSARPDQIGADALGGAISKGLVPPAEMTAWISALRAHPKSNSQLLLVADTAEMVQNPAKKSELAKNTADRVRNAPLPDRIAALRWLIGVGEPALASSLLTSDEALKSPETLALWLDSLSLQNQWAPILQTLDNPQNPLPKHLQSLYKARALSALNRSDEASAAYEQAYNESQADTEDFLETLAYLSLAGQDALFEQGLKQNLSNPDLAEPTLRTLVPAVARHRDAAKTRRIYELATTIPALSENPTIQNDLDYLTLLLNQPVDLQRLKSRSEANPRDFSFRVTAAMGLLRASRGKEALELLENCEPDVHVATLAPHQKVVVAAALAASNRRPESLHVASMVPPMALSVQEVELLQAHLAQPEPNPTPAAENPAKKKKG